MLKYPEINPIALKLGPVTVHWYGVMYLLGFALAWLMARARASQNGFTKTQVSDLIFYGALGVILGGRIGYVVIYDTAKLWHAPWEIAYIWQGGMSFHGGLLGVLIMMMFFAHSCRRSYIQVMDFTAPLVPLGLATGRLGNFINGELWGRVTEQPWGMIFSHVDQQPRHPSQLYELFFEGIVLFIIMWLYSKRRKPVGAVSAVFLIGYGIFRFILEFFRMPDAQMGFYWHHLTMGQLLSIPMVLLGIVLWIWAYCFSPDRKEIL